MHPIDDNHSGTNLPESFMSKYKDILDPDGDGFVDVNDVTTTINHILGKPVVNFVFEAANIDGDDTIDVNDVQGIIDIALGKNK
jgi:Ca2+-binding EF-hand superfamily protein